MGTYFGILRRRNVDSERLGDESSQEGISHRHEMGTYFGILRRRNEMGNPFGRFLRRIALYSPFSDDDFHGLDDDFDRLEESSNLCIYDTVDSERLGEESSQSSFKARYGYTSVRSYRSPPQTIQSFDEAQFREDVVSFAIPKSQTAIIRSEKKVVSKLGATIDLYITGITLKVPKGAFEDETVVQLATLDPATIPKISLDFGEVLLSDIIKVGPDEARFNVPATLSIPHSVTDIPRHSSICICHFDAHAETWVSLPRSDINELDANCGYVKNPGLYALCLLLDTEYHVITATSTVIHPFSEENGVAITFDEETFDNDQTKVKFKINTLTTTLFTNFKSAGIKPSVILHINAANNEQPKKPVSIAMPIPKDVNQDENIRIFQCDHGDDFTDVTEKISFKIKDHWVILRVDHFTKYWIFGTSIEVPDFAPLLNLFYPIYDVCFSVYMKAESIRVGCCEWNARKVMHNEMTFSFTYTNVDFIKGKLRNGDTSTIAMHGSYKISGNASGVQLIFNANDIEYTNPLYLEASESSKETPLSLNNEVIISIDMEGARDPVFLKFLKEDDSAIQYPYQPLVTKNKRNLSSDKEDRDSIATTKDLLLLDLCEDYSFMQELESKLEDTSTNNIKDLLLILELSNEDRCKILESATLSLAFFENLSKSRPQLSLRELKASIEKVTTNAQPNMTIFLEIEKDIANGLVSVTLDTTLGELSNNPKDWRYALETIAGNLNPKEGTLLKSWKDIAGNYGYKSSDILAFQRKNMEESPTRKLFSLLCAKSPSFSVCLLVEKLKQIRREDVANMVERWLDDTVKQRSIQREERKLASEEE